MNYLLDTHVLIWAFSDKGKLSHRIQQELNEADNIFFISSVSFWEIALKFSIGKLNINGITPDALPELSLNSGFQLIPLSAIESATCHKLNVGDHKDPFDRMLVWQAIQRDLTLITKDDRLNQYRIAGLKTLW